MSTRDREGEKEGQQVAPGTLDVTGIEVNMFPEPSF